MPLSAVDRERRGVSTVIGVLLLVAVTVILATVVSVFALDIGADSTQTTPQMGWEFDFNEGDVQATLVSGDAVEGEYLLVEGDGCSVDPTGTGTINAGTTLTIGDSCPTSGVTINIVWESPEDDTTAIVGRFTN